jgi:hypothetical protein
MPWPLSAMRMSLRPPASISMRMRVAPASGGDLVRHEVGEDADAAHESIVRGGIGAESLDHYRRPFD